MDKDIEDVDLEKLYTASEMSIKIGKNSNYLSQCVRNFPSLIENMNYIQLEVTIIFSEDPTVDLTQLVSAKQGSKMLGKTNSYLAHIAKVYPEKLEGINYKKIGRSLVFTKKGIAQLKKDLKKQKARKKMGLLANKPVFASSFWLGSVSPLPTYTH